MTATVDKAVADPQQTIAELRRQLDERTAERDDASAREAAAAEVLGVINSSHGDLAPVFDAILEKACLTCGFAHGTLNTYDGDHFRTVAFQAIPERFAEVLRQPRKTGPQEQPLRGERIHERLLRGERIVHIADVTAPEFQSNDPVYRAAVEHGGVRTVLMVPLRKDGALLGYITANRREVQPFSEKQVGLLENFAAQAVIAMENARLITETREALEQQTATAEVLQVINSSPGDLGPVFDAMLERAMLLCGAKHGYMYTYDGERLHAAAIRGEQQFVDFMRGRQPIGLTQVGTPLQRAFRSGGLVQIHDVLQEEAYRASPSFKELIDIGGIRGGVIVPLFKESSFLGSIHIFRREVGSFGEKQIALLQNFAAQAVIAMENARLLGELHERTEEVAGWNRELEARVAAQLAELERTGKLRRFLAPQLADLIVAQGDESILESHRREIVVVFCDLRGFTSFAERAEPEEVMALLRDYHAAMGPIVAQYEGTLDHYAGDGIMVFFNDPIPTPDPARRAIEMAVAMREAAQVLLRSWRRHGHDIGFGVGISQGYATLGQIGFAERMDYTAIGTVTNLAARLCAEAKDGQILVSRRVAIAVEDAAQLEEIGDLSLKGLSQAVAVYNVGAQTSAS
jgi:adenylate cyclase